MSGRHKLVPNVSQPQEMKWLLVRVPAKFRLDWSRHCKVLGIPQAVYLMRLFEQAAAPAQTAQEHAAEMLERGEQP